jgi:hypothetical protein
MSPTELGLIVIVATGLLCVALFIAVQAIGHLNDQRLESDEKTRLACDEAVKRVQDTERRIAERDARSIELVRDMMRSNHYGGT